jgi:hypothetical protein
VNIPEQIKTSDKISDNLFQNRWLNISGMADQPRREFYMKPAYKKWYPLN